MRTSAGLASLFVLLVAGCGEDAQTTTTGAATNGEGDGGFGGFGGGFGTGSGGDGDGAGPFLDTSSGGSGCPDATCPELGVNCDEKCGALDACDAFACDDGPESIVLGFGQQGVRLPPIDVLNATCAVDCPAALYTLRISLNGTTRDPGCIAFSTPYGVVAQVVRSVDEIVPPACPDLLADLCDEGQAYPGEDESFLLISVLELAAFGRVVVIDHRPDDCDGIAAPDCEAAGCNGSGD